LYVQVVLADSATRLRTSSIWVRIKRKVNYCRPFKISVTVHSAADVTSKKHSVKWERNSLPALGLDRLNFLYFQNRILSNSLHTVSLR